MARQDNTLAMRITRSLIEARQERDKKIAEAAAAGRLVYIWTRDGRLAVGRDR